MAETQSPAAGDGRARESSSLARDASQYTSAAADTQYQLIAKIRKNAREEFRIGIRQFTHFRGVDLRVFSLNAKGEFIETPRAVAVRFPALPQIITALQLAAEAEGA